MRHRDPYMQADPLSVAPLAGIQRQMYNLPEGLDPVGDYLAELARDARARKTALVPLPPYKTRLKRERGLQRLLEAKNCPSCRASRAAERKVNELQVRILRKAVRELRQKEQEARRSRANSLAQKAAQAVFGE